MTAAHPTYPNPTIIQVTCEIAFASSDDVKLSAGMLYPIFANEFPEVQPVANLTLQVVFAQSGMAPEMPQAQNPTAAYRFTTADGRRFVQVSKTNFIYQSNDAYLGWADFQTKLFDLWDKVSPQLKPLGIEKIGLRYINRIPMSEVYPHLSYWLRPTENLPGSLLNSHAHFLARIESSPMVNHLRLVTIAKEQATPEAPFGGIFFDIDRVSQDKIAADNRAILEKLEFLHEDSWKTFDDACSDIFKRRLSGVIA